MDSLLALLGATDSSPKPTELPEPTSTTAILTADRITLITLNYYVNDKGKETWISAKQTLRLQFFSETQRFTPHYNLADLTCTVQFHEPFWWEGYIANYAVENKGSRPIPTPEQLQWYKDLTVETTQTHPDAKLGLPYSTPGTTYHWGSAVRLRENKYGELLADLYLDCKLFKTLRLDEPNLDRNEKTANIKWRGRYDPNNLWKVKSKGRKK